MTIDQSVNDFLSGGGAKSAKFENPGDTVVGTITDAKVTEQTDLDGKVRTWDDGSAKTQLVITLATDQRDPADDNDDGSRNVYLKGSKKDPSTGAGALIAALRNAGATGLDVGGKFAMRFTGLGTPSKAGLNAPKQYVIQYEAPALVAGGDLFGNEAQQAPAQAPVAAPAPAQPAPAAPAQPAPSGGDMLAGV